MEVSITEPQLRVESIASFDTENSEFFHEFPVAQNHDPHQGIALLGGKGLGLINMSSWGVLVPRGFVIDTRLCQQYFEQNRNLSAKFLDALGKNLSNLEIMTKKRFVSREDCTTERFLLVSVRSGAPVSMPGMMDTILNIGLTRGNLEVIAQIARDRRFVLNSYLRLLESFSQTVFNTRLDSPFDKDKNLHARLDEVLRSDYKNLVTEEELDELAHMIESLIEQKGFGDIIASPTLQIKSAIEAVLESFYSSRATAYREMHNMDADMGTAVIVQEMVFGNLNCRSATGVVFSRDPNTGENELFGEFAVNAQGEDVVSGVLTPQAIRGSGSETMEFLFPECFEELRAISNLLEEKNKDMQDIEFTIESDKLFVLQSRSGKRSKKAEIRILTDLVAEKLISSRTALSRIDPNSLCSVLHPVFANTDNLTPILKGLGASPGAAAGRAVFTPIRALELERAGDCAILVRNDTSPEDITGMKAAVGILTARGGMTSHAAVVARGMGKPCVCGASNLKVFDEEGYAEIRSGHSRIRIAEGDFISLNGETGEVFQGEVERVMPDLSQDFSKIIAWVEELDSIEVRANADSERDVKTAFSFGAKGVGLCRTEHMFFAEERILNIRKMILAVREDDRLSALSFIKEFQKEDFAQILRASKGCPVTIRLLDPPLHEFLPGDEVATEKFIAESSLDRYEVFDKIKQLSEKNPMLGHRGCRLGITHPEIYEAQVEAIFEAAIAVKAEGLEVALEVMIPLVAWERECLIMTNLVRKTADRVIATSKTKLMYSVGLMIELPRAALFADTLAKHVDFFSFGTNDLTQTVLGISRDDMAAFLPSYKEAGIITKENDPFVNLDDGVVELMRIAVKKARSVKPKIKIGICGEHAGSARSIAICQELGLNYVSVSPFRVPIALVASAQCSLELAE